MDGELWREHRKFSLLTLRSFGMGRSVLEQTIHSEVLILLKLFRARSQAFDPGDLIYVSVSNVINALSFGGHFKHDDSRYKEMIKKVSENFANVGLSGIGFFIPGLVHLPGDMLKIKQTLKNAEDVYSFLREFSIEHLQNYDENNIDNFTSAFIKEMKKQERLQETSTYTSKYDYYKRQLSFKTAVFLLLYSFSYLIDANVALRFLQLLC